MCVPRKPYASLSTANALVNRLSGKPVNRKPDLVNSPGHGPVAQWQSRGLLILVSKVRSLPGSRARKRALPPSSRGPGHRPFKAAARVRIPLGAQGFPQGDPEERAISSGVEHLPYKEGVAGSNPASPTRGNPVDKPNTRVTGKAPEVLLDSFTATVLQPEQRSPSFRGLRGTIRLWTKLVIQAPPPSRPRRCPACRGVRGSRC